MINLLLKLLKNKKFQIFLFFNILFLYQVSPVDAASPYGGSGWTVAIAEFVETDIVTCGVSSTVGQIEIVEHDTLALVPLVPQWRVDIHDVDDNLLWFWEASLGENKSPKFCYQFGSDEVKVRVSEDATYFKHSGVKVNQASTEPPSFYYGDSYLGRVHLLRKTSPEQNITPVSPSMGSIVNASPDFVIRTDSILDNRYNSDSLLRTKYYVQNAFTGVLYDNEVPASGTSGTFTLPSLTLPDGFYYWVFMQATNAEITLSNGLVLKNGAVFSGLSEASVFVLDTTPPITNINLNVTSFTSSSMSASIKVNLHDVTSGLKSTKIYVNDAASGLTIATIALTLPPLTTPYVVNAGVTLSSAYTYEYFSVTCDVAGNCVTSTVKTIVPPVVALPPVASIDSPSSAPYESDALNFINFTGKVEDDSGSLIPDSDVLWEWNISSCNGPLYSDQKVFSTSTENNLIPADGVPVSIFLKVRENSTGLWSTNCPSVDIDIICPVTEFWDGSQCSIIPVPSATLSANTCDVALNDSSCTADFTWDILNASLPNLYNTTLSLVYSTAASGTSIPFSVDYGDNIVQAQEDMTAVGAAITVTVACSAGLVWDLALVQCVNIVVPYPDLISKNLNLSTGPYLENSAITLSAEVENIGTSDAVHTFGNDFGYSWDGGSTWTTVIPFGSHAGLAVGVTEFDSITFTPTVAGSLHIRHCVDSYNDIDEDSNESPNCTSSGPYTVVPLPSATLSGVSCLISLGDTDCDGSLTWNITDSASPNLHNLTSNITYNTNPSGSNVNYLLQKGSNVISARNGSDSLTSILLTAGCDTLINIWDGSTCITKPLVSITPFSPLVRADNSTTITIAITTTVDLSCIVYGANLIPDMFNYLATDTSVSSITTKPLKFTQIISMSCTDGGSVVVSSEARILVVGDWKEL